MPRWFTRPQAVTHPSTNRAQCRLTTLIEANALTTTLRRHPWIGRSQKGEFVHIISHGNNGKGRRNSVIRMSEHKLDYLLTYSEVKGQGYQAL